MTHDASRGVTGTVCSSEAGLLIWIKPQLALRPPALISRDARGQNPAQVAP
jgi:hypothetical protein